MIRVARGAIVAALCLTGTPAFAQSKASVTLQPENPARWDAAIHVGWLGVNKSDIAPDWNDYYEAATFGGSTGYYFTPHLKFEVDVAKATRGQVYSYPLSPVEFRPRLDDFRATSFGGTVSYQFLENTWFHPFLGVGVDIVRESSRTMLPEFITRTSPTVPIVILPAQTGEWQTSVDTHPLATAGFKWYVAERAFIRSDVRAAFSRKQLESIVWRGGVGFDF